MVIEYKVTGSDEHEMFVTITIDGVEHSMEELEAKYDQACENGSDDAAELEDITFKAWRVLRDVKWNARHQRVSNFWANNPDHECEDSDPVIRNW